MILLTRSQYLDLSGTELQAYKSLRRRDQVPRFGSSGRAESDEEEAAKGYLAIEAVMLALSNDLCASGGLDRSLSARIVENNPELVVNGIPRAEAGEDVWLAHVAWREQDGTVCLDLCEMGTLPELIESVKQYQFDDGNSAFADVFRITLTSISRVVQQVRSRAAKAGFDFGPFLVA